MGALESPGVAVRPPELAVDARKLLRLTARSREELICPRDTHLVSRLQLGQEPAKLLRRRMRPVVVRSYEDRDVPRGCAGDQRVAHCGPRCAQRIAVRRKRSADLVALRREVIHQQLAAGRPPPPHQITSLVTQPAPQHRSVEGELASEIGKNRWMAESVRRIEYVEPAAQAGRVGAADEEVAHQRLARGDLLVGQHIPGPDLEPPGSHQSAHQRLAIRPYREVVLEQNRLPVQEEGLEGRISLESFEQVVEQSDQSDTKGRLREIPLPVPVRMEDQVEDERCGCDGRPTPSTRGMAR